MIQRVAELRRAGLSKREAWDACRAGRSRGARLTRRDLEVCLDCPEFSPEPDSRWLGLSGRDNPRCLASSRQLAARWLGLLPPCDRILARRAAPRLPIQVGLLTPTLLFGGAERWVAALAVGLDPAVCDVVGVAIRDEVRAAWDVGPDEILVGYVGRMLGEKRPLAAVEAAAVLGPPFRAVLAGGGLHTDYWLAEARKLMPDVVYQPPVEQVGDMYRAVRVTAEISSTT